MKKKLLTVLALVLVVGLVLCLLPWSRTVSVHTTAYEYTVGQKEPLAVRDVVIEGRYTVYVFQENQFDGPLSVSGYDYSQQMPAKVQFWHDRNPGMISYRDEAGQPLGRELANIFCSRDFTRFTIQIFDQERQDDHIISHWNGRVLCADAPDYETMAALSAQVGFHVEEIE